MCRESDVDEPVRGYDRYPEVYRLSAMRMAWAGAMPRPLLAIFSISTVFSPGAVQPTLPMHALGVSLMVGELECCVCAWSKTACTILTTQCTTQDSKIPASIA